ncbi:YfaZ family outer membrane protein [Shewanella pneumatophori]|uniref:YfaZ family protein n=1 Tax=Shewanella pneumatophori TaxID=314092 RepID=A0A9X1ZA89_9GAMM|nr:YfaZ family outer membrane protein [Shewanella pneumatophori]MCL1138524.1 YfaZ family protein [Shewanella pneumatophori]
MKSKFLFGALALSAVSVNAQATDFTFGLNDDMLSTELQFDVNKDVNASVEYIYADTGGQMLSGAMHIAHDAGIHHFELGAKFSQVWSERSANGNFVGIGGRYAMQLGSNISLHGAGYYSPSVLSFGDIDGSWQFDGKVQYALNPALALFVGYRNIRLQYDHAPNSTLDSGFYLGAKASF